MAKSSTKTQLERRARRAMFEQAFFRWESAASIAVFILLAFFWPQPFPWWQPWFWLIAGVIAISAIVGSSITDPEFGRKVVAQMLQTQFELGRLRDPKNRAYMEKALTYRERIQEAIMRHRTGVLRDGLQETAREVDEWIESIYKLGVRLDDYQQDHFFKQEIQSARKQVRELQDRSQQENDPNVKAHLEDNLQDAKIRLTNLGRHESEMERRELLLESKLTSMGTIYSQILLLDADDIHSGRAQRLREEIKEEVQEMQDVLDAMDEVHETSASF